MKTAVSLSNTLYEKKEIMDKIENNIVFILGIKMII
jgi:hypothetical protein